MRCGPEGLGQCVGPSICCGASFGCFINTLEAAACSHENDIQTPCRLEGIVCGDEGQGQCVADGICCSDGKGYQEICFLLLQYDKRHFTSRKDVC